MNIQTLFPVLLLFPSAATAAPLAYVLSNPDSNTANIVTIDSATLNTSNFHGVAAGNLVLEVDTDHQRIYSTGDLRPIDGFDTDKSSFSVFTGNLNRGQLAPLLDGKRIALTNFVGNEVLIATRGISSVTRVPIPSRPTAVIAHPDGISVYVLTDTGDLYQLDLRTMTAAQRTTGLCNLTTLTADLAITIEGRFLYSACGRQVSRVDLITFIRTNTNVVGSGALRELALTADGTTLYTVDLDTAGGNHHLIRLATPALGATSQSIGDAPSSLAIHPDDHTVYVTMPNAGVSGGGAVRIFEGTTLTLLSSVTTIAKPGRVRFAELPMETRRWLDDLGTNLHQLWPSEYRTIRLVDVTGDGRDDLCLRLYSEGRDGLYCAKNLGGRFDVLRRWSPEYGGLFDGLESLWSTIQYADLNDDGAMDVCGRSLNGMLCALSDGLTKFHLARNWAPALAGFNPWSNAAYYRTIQLADVNGDGRADLCARNVGGMQCGFSNGSTAFTGWRYFSNVTPIFPDAQEWDNGPQYYETITLGDVDGDGYADACGRRTGGVVCALNRSQIIGGSRFFSAPTMWQSTISDANGFDFPEQYQTMQLADVDGDHKLDLCVRSADGVHCYRSNATAFVASAPTAGFAPAFSDANGWNVDSHYLSIRVVDIDGDGLGDVCGRGADGVICMRGVAQNGDVAYRPEEYRIRDFGDDRGWGASEVHWWTVQPGQLDQATGLEFCGRAGAGIGCSNH